MIKIGTPLLIELSSSNQDEVERYRCKLVEMNNFQLFIDYPVNERTGRTGFFLEGTECKVSFVGKDDSIYMFHSEVRGRKKLTIPVLLLSYPGQDKLLRIQRREYVRIETAVDVAVHDPLKRFSPFTSVTFDISGGGAAVILPTDHHLKSGMEIEVWFVIHLNNGDIKYLQTTSRVVRIVFGGGVQRDKASLQFMDIRESDQQTIVRFCFERQLALRNRRIK